MVLGPPPRVFATWAAFAPILADVQRPSQPPNDRNAAADSAPKKIANQAVLEDLMVVACFALTDAS